mmetsp:Transcript_61369/g.143678  ORF Transcript_61369/g.143678 Transcript_61369/m.143678 type:complete len:1162 (-) Transcript_61369:100-3585(-)
MSAELQGLLQALLAQQLAQQLPKESISTAEGFTWLDALKSVNCSAGGKEAVCVESRMATIFTRQVINKEDECLCAFQVLCAGGEKAEPIFLGIVGDTPMGFDSLAIGNKALSNSIGICSYAAAGQIVHNGETKGAVPGIRDGDIVKIQVRKGSQVSIIKDDRSILSFHVGGDGNFRLAASLCCRGQAVKILDAEQGSVCSVASLLSGDSSQEALRVVAALAEAIGDRAVVEDGAGRLPKEAYTTARGFTWVDTLRSVDCDARDKLANCVISRAATMVTAQILTSADECDFVMQIRSVGGEDEPIGFGVVDATPVGFATLPIGHRELRHSIGACCGRKEGFIVHQSEQQTSCPGLAAGDVVKVRVRKGSHVSLCMGSTEVSSFKVGGDGKFRIGATLFSKGQTVEIIDAVASERPGKGALKVGYEVELPLQDDPRLPTMRTKFAEALERHCGKAGQVVQVAKRCVRVSYDGREYWWDTELFPSTVQRYCFEGCRLTEHVAPKPSHVCDVCHVRLPAGASMLRCLQHDYDVCKYCQGRTEVPGVGTKVIRGPTWKWMQQDVTPYAEGVCRSAPDEDGWVKVQWRDGSTYNYRTTRHHQDVWPAHANGLEGEKPTGENDAGVNERHAVLEVLKRMVAAGHGVASSQTLPRLPFSEDVGFTFAELAVAELVVGSSKKDVRAEGDCLGSVVTEQVVESTQQSTCNIQIKCLPPGGIFAWGLCTAAASNFQREVPGSSAFTGSIGCLLLPDGKLVRSVVLQNDTVVASLPQVQEGDTVGIQVAENKCEFLHQGEVVHSVQIRGSFRFVASLSKAGQQICIQSSRGGQRSAPWKDFVKVVPDVEVGSGSNQLSFDESTKLGEGGFGSVYRGRLRGDTVVVKKMKAEKMTEALQRDFDQEVQALASLRHPNLLIFLAINAPMHLIVTEFCEHGDLRRFLTTGAGASFGANDRRVLMQEVAKGMACIAGQRMVHRDLKPENVLIAKGPIARVGDFGLARPLAMCQSEKSAAGTIMYMAPETFLGDVSEKSDVYSYSLVLGFTFGMEELDVAALTGLELVALMAQLNQDSALVQQFVIEKIRTGRRPQIPETMPAVIKSLVTTAWDEKPERRPTFVSLCESLTQPLPETKIHTPSKKAASHHHFFVTSTHKVTGPRQQSPKNEPPQCCLVQ